MKIDLFTQTGEKKGEIALNSKIFGQKVNHDLIHQYLTYQMANGRVAIAHAKTKAEIRGGGRKPFAQKGTGNARQGSIRNPHMRGGGVAFGPRNIRNFSLRMPKMQRRKALFAILSSKAKEQQILAVENYTAPKISTKHFQDFLKKLPIQKNVLLVLPKKDPIVEKSCRNLPMVKSILVNYLNPHDIFRYEKLLFAEEALKKLEEIFLQSRIANKHS